MSREEAMWTMAPYTFDASTPREVIAGSSRSGCRATVSNDGFAAARGHPLWPGSLSRLGAVSGPTLVIHARPISSVPPENGRILARAIPHATLDMLRVPATSS